MTTGGAPTSTGDDTSVGMTTGGGSTSTGDDTSVGVMTGGASTSTGGDVSTGGASTSAGDDVSMGGASTSTGDDMSTGELVPTNIEVTVNYEGALSGTLTVVAWVDFPPMSPSSAIVVDPEPVFAWSGTLMDLEPGEYFIFATLDFGDNNPTVPGSEDPQVVTDMPVVVDGVEPISVELTLTDPID